MQVDTNELEEIFFGSSVLLSTEKTLASVYDFYDDRGRKTQTTKRNFSTLDSSYLDVNTYFDYDDKNRLWRIRNDEGTFVQYEFDAAGRKRSETDFDGKVDEFVYNGFNNLIKTIEDADYLARLTEFAFDRFGRKISITSGADSTVYEYNASDKETSISYADGKTIDFDYDLRGNIRQRIVTENSVSLGTNYDTDSLGRVINKQIDDDLVWNDPNDSAPLDQFIYDGAGRRFSASKLDGENELEFNIYSYNAFGNLTCASETYGDFSCEVVYGYDQMGQLSGVTYPDEKQAIFTRDALGRIISIDFNGARVLSMKFWSIRLAELRAKLSSKTEQPLKQIATIGKPPQLA